MSKIVYNVVNKGDKLSIGFKLQEDLPKGTWINFNCWKNQIKDRSLDDKNLLDI